MIAKIAIITGLVIGYLLIGFLFLFVVNKLYCWVFDEVLIDEAIGVVFVLLYPILIPILLIGLLWYGISCAIEHINDSILGHSEYYEEDGEDGDN